MALKYLILSYITEVLLEILNIRMSSFRDCCNTKALLAKKKIEIIWENSNLDCLDIRCDFGESEVLERETGHTHCKEEKGERRLKNVLHAA